MSKLRERLAKHRGAQPDALTCAVCGDTYVRAALSADGESCVLFHLVISRTSIFF